MNNDDINNKIEQFDLLAKDMINQLSGLSALLSERKVPSDSETDALNINIRAIRKCYNEITALAKENLSGEEMPPAGSSINAYLNAAGIGMENHASDLFAGLERKTDPDENSETPLLPDPAQILDPVRQYEGITPDDPMIKKQAETIELVLDTYGAPATVTAIHCGPAFTQFDVEPGFIERGRRKSVVPFKKIEALRPDLEMALTVKQLTIDPPADGESFVRICVGNQNRIPVSLREVIESGDFRKRGYELGIALGKDYMGTAFSEDLRYMPHLLIGGASGTGKFVFLNAILSCLLLHNSPERLKLFITGLKYKELTEYNGLPHLIAPVTTDIDRTCNVLKWVQDEMNMRRQHLLENGVSDFQAYNRKFPDKQLPYIVVVIDELTNLMLEAGHEIENIIVLLARSAQMTGIHLIVLSTYLSRDLISDTIKGNFLTRIAFNVPSQIDSRVIIDRPGAEELFEKGDMYLLSAEETSLKRLQCVTVSDDEVRRIVSWWRKKRQTAASPEKQDPDPVDFSHPDTEKIILDPEAPADTSADLADDGNTAQPPAMDGDVLYDTAVKLVRRVGKASAAMLECRLNIGTKRANKLLARMEEEGIIGKPVGNPYAPRLVLDHGENSSENDNK